MILVIDNYDSFTYNLVQYLGEMGRELVVRRNDRITLAEADALRPDSIVISPGPCTPREAGISNDIIEHFAGRVPILGVCLGHQCIGHVFGARIVRANRLMHGKTSMIHHDGRAVYRGLSSPFRAVRYHSLIVDRASVPGSLEITAESEIGEIMGIRHRDYPVEGVQFHPESVLTDVGKDLLRNFLEVAAEARNEVHTK